MAELGEETTKPPAAAALGETPEMGTPLLGLSQTLALGLLGRVGPKGGTPLV